MDGDNLIIILLFVCILLGAGALLLAGIHYVQWKRFSKLFPVTGYETTGKSPKFDEILSSAVKPLSINEKKYFLLFLDGKTTDEIAAAMHVEPSSVYTMKYRIRKKFPDDYLLPF